jgi:alkane 1-monooxygenase
MKSTPLKNACYLLTLLPMMLLVFGVLVGLPWLSVLFFFIVLPILRRCVGNDLSAPNTGASQLMRAWLSWVPRIYCIVWSVVLLWSGWLLSSSPLSITDQIGFAVSLWVVSSLNLPISHELIHAGSRVDRFAGRLLAASVGYGHFPEEHAYHHAQTGHAHGGDVASPATSIYRYAIGRYVRTWPIAWTWEGKRLKRNHQCWFRSALTYTALLPILIAGLFFAFAGLRGLGCYSFQVVGAAFTVQAITYLQHWGLSQRDTPELADYGFTWEDCCWMQACITLNHAFHAQHHLTPSRRYFELQPIANGLRLPASYPVMFVVALFPKFFRRVMRAQLQQWRELHKNNERAAHNDDCIGMKKLSILAKNQINSQ